jgi:hypothetical protein
MDQEEKSQHGLNELEFWLLPQDYKLCQLRTMRLKKDLGFRYYHKVKTLGQQWIILKRVNYGLK